MKEANCSERNLNVENANTATPVMVPAPLLCQRLKIEALLLRLGAVPHVHRNQILLLSESCSAMITLTQTQQENTLVKVEASVGEILLVDGLTDFLRARNQQVAPIRLELDDRVIRVTWQSEFADDVDPHKVVDALGAVVAVVDSIRTTLHEDFLLAGVGYLPTGDTSRKETR